MRWFALCLMMCAVVGCAPPAEDVITEPKLDMGTSGTTTDAPAAVEATAPPISTSPEATPEATPAEPAKTDSGSKSGDSTIRFVANKSLKVPTMSCPHGCWPKVKETLAAQPGVEAVQLATQAKEGEIDNPVVELKTTVGFDAQAAIAALEKSSFPDAVVVN
jgi:copper chaperone CopZ